MEIQAKSCLNQAAQEKATEVSSTCPSEPETLDTAEMLSLLRGKPRLLALPEGLCRSLQDKDPIQEVVKVVTSMLQEEMPGVEVSATTEDPSLSQVADPWVEPVGTLS